MRKKLLTAVTIMACGMLVACGEEKQPQQTTTIASSVASTEATTETTTEAESKKDGTSTIQGSWQNYVLSEKSKQKVTELLTGKVYDNKDSFDIDEFGFTEEETKFKEQLYKGVKYAFYDHDANGTNKIINTRSKVEVDSITFGDERFSIVLKYFE